MEMMVSTKDKYYLAAKASYIHERLDGCVILLPRDNSDAAQKLERWKKLLNGKTAEDSFSRRLNLTGKTENEIIPFLGDVDWNHAIPLPEWLITFEDVCSLLPLDVDTGKANLPEGVFLEAEPLQFEDYWLPWLLHAAGKIRAANPDIEQYFTSAAVGAWLRGCLVSLTKRMSLPLLSAFDMTRNNGIFLSCEPATLSSKTGSRKLYRKFIGQMLSGEMLDFAKRYAVAARLSSQMLQNSISYFNAVIQALRTDLPEIAIQFNAGIAPGRIVSLQTNLSDPHNQGRTVIKFKFEQGLTLIYKPRSFDVDKRWENFLHWCTGHCPEIDFITPRHVGDGDHVWVECLENSSLKNVDDAGAFYRRCGALLATAYVLNGYDFHQENLMACGHYPVLIDLETVLRPLVKPFNYEDLDEKTKEQMLDMEGDSVLRTSFLPMWMPISKSVVRDYGALTPDDNVNYMVLEWVDINTDGMRREYVERKTSSSPNVPHFNENLMNVTDYIPELLDGFRKLYQLFIDNKNQIPLDLFNDSTLRFLPRSSQIYGDMIYRLFSPTLLRDGALFSIEIEGMGQAFIQGVSTEKLPDIWKVFEQERRSLESLNIPLFETRADSTAVFEKGKPILKDYFLLSAIDEAKRRLVRLSSLDMDFQSQLIAGALSCRYPKSENETNEQAEQILATSIKAPQLTNDQFIAVAADIAAEIAEKVVRKGTHLHWLTRKFDPISHLLNIGPVDSLLYEGTAGIGLFLSAYSHISGDRQYDQLARDCFDNLREIFQDENIKTMAKWISPGYAGGIMGALWASAMSSSFLGHDEKLDALVTEALDLFSEESIRNDRNLDLIGGAAGGLLTLLEFHRLYPQPKLLAWATECGEHLLRQRVDFQGSPLWLPEFALRPLCGLGHGLSGYAYAFLKLYGATRDQRFHDAAVIALNYEKREYLKKVHNWPDFRINKDLKNNQVGQMSGWCSGAPGVGMARLMALDLMDNAQIRADIENAITHVREIDFKPYLPDHLCCGFAGRIDFLIEASVRLDRPELIQEARRQLSVVVNRAHLNGHYMFAGGSSNALFMPGFFSGISGVGYTALRLVKPQALPTFLVPVAARP